MNCIQNWSLDEVERICSIALNNDQVGYVIRESIISNFLKRIICSSKASGSNTKRVYEIIRDV